MVSLEPVASFQAHGEYLDDPHDADALDHDSDGVEARTYRVIAIGKACHWPCSLFG